MSQIPASRPVAGSWIEIPVAEAAQVAATRLRSWWARPAEGPLCGGVLVLPEVFGVNPWVRSVAGRLASEGYGALALPLFGRTAPDLELDYSEASLAEGRRHKDLTTTPQLLADGAAAAQWLQNQLVTVGSPGSAEGWPGLGCVGFCFGGHAALLIATLPGMAATCDFYGAGVASGRPGGGLPSLELLDQVAGRLWCFLGDQDPLIPPADGAAIAAALAAADPSGERHRLITAPGAGHGYMCSARGAYEPTAATEGWRRMLDLFASELTAEG
ncbi:dienelactone hydrolase family protein [Cyanobium sp. Morenito 9A2]|uniref:dienelactone hydrolase family protein n=1 Tax=Cyanobium sp. Morenito 9A2 TaxID=2823718 RepID=UPI0020CDC70F|nr:dienelactone hydrolase family protein [Cyanobium sp. Morenito 9A2]MCP9850222.1 dienelactone hydrolase family protein [Cyanobium sp. Morenito 9A2]